MIGDRFKLVATTLVLALVAASACKKAEDGAVQEKAQDPVVAETPEAYRDHAAKLRREGKFQEAADAALKAFVLARTGPRVAERVELAKAYGAGGNSAGAINEIKSLEAEKREGKIELDEVDIAETYAIIGDPNAVFRWLTRAVDKKSAQLDSLANNLDLASVRTDPRWDPFVASVGK